MGKIAVLAEKPSVGKDIARVLGCNKTGNGYFEGNHYVVTWAMGHLVSLADPDVYDKKYDEWNLGDLPILPSHLQLIVIKQTGRQFHIVKELLLRQDIEEVVIATDAGREGELVARWILEKIQIKKPLKRLWISSVTDKAIQEGFRKLRLGKDYEPLFHAAVARAEADWFVGINATRALTCKYNAQLSAGRVQTPTLAIIAQRDEEIQRFIPKDFWGITAVANGVKLIWRDEKDGNHRSFNRERCEKTIAALHGAEAIITQIDTVHKKNFSPQLYDLTELQRDANKIWGYSAKETLSIMQRLYESHKVLTYPRTDSRFISHDIVETLTARLKACGGGAYAKPAFTILKKGTQVGKHFVDDGKVTDHHAIIPTEEYVNLSAFNERERKIYDLVVKRFLAVLYPPFEYEQIQVTAKIGEASFVAKGKTVIANGWKEIYENQYEDEAASEDIVEQILPKLQNGAVLQVSSLAISNGKTKPPAHFTEASLLSAMENPAQYISAGPEALKKTLNETGGLGTVATRADIIEKLFGSFLLEKKGKEIFITSKGRQLLELVPAELKSPALTAEWEQKLSLIAQGRMDKNIFIGDMKTYARNVVNQIKNSQEQFKHDNLTRTKCPECGKYMLEVNGKKGKMLICQDRECGCRKGLSRATNARCPHCHKKLEMRGEGDGKLFICSCGYREKLSAFQNRKSQEKGNMSKRDATRFIKEQQKDDNGSINSALADALAQLKL